MSSLLVVHALLFSYHMVQYLVASQFLLAPNIIFVLTDDQDLELKSMDAMPNVKADIIDKGITFTNAFATTPVCCPSRTETVAGRQYHNVQGSGVQCQGVSAYYNLYTNPDSLFNKFHNNGYLTGGFGKITNDMAFCNDDNAADLSSFDRLHVSCNYYDFYWPNYFNKYVGNTEGVISENNVITDDLYQTAMLGNASIDFISQQLELQENNDPNAKPFIMWIAPYAPHTPAFPATWYQNEFNDITLVEDANYNCDVTNHHPPIDTNPEINDDAEATMLLLHQNRLRSLLSVDDMVHGIVETIDTFNNAWDNTYIIYASDHGYHIGQYRIPCGKSQPYETTIRIPLYIRGPGVVSGEVSDALVSNIDFLPTFLDLAGIDYSIDTYDGRSVKNLMENGNQIDYNSDWRQILLFEYKTIKGTETGIGISKCASWDPDSILPANGDTKSVASGTWKLDNIYNNWRVLRIKNESVNWMYGEFVDIDWNDAAFENPQFYEFYDLNTDEYQLNNVYDTYLTSIQKELLHSLVMQYGECSGADSCSPITSIQSPITTSTTTTTASSTSSTTSTTSSTVATASESTTATTSTSATSTSATSTSTTSTSAETTRGKGGKGGGGGNGGKGGRSNAESIHGAMKGIDYDNNYDDDDDNDFFGSSSGTKDGYKEIALVLSVGIIACGAFGIGILIGKQLEKRPYVLFDDNKV